MNFNAEEMELIAAFFGANRTETLEAMQDMARLLERVIPRLEAMSDKAFDGLKPEVSEVWDE